MDWEDLIDEVDQSKGTWEADFAMACLQVVMMVFAVLILATALAVIIP